MSVLITAICNCSIWSNSGNRKYTIPNHIIIPRNWFVIISMCEFLFVCINFWVKKNRGRKLLPIIIDILIHTLPTLCRHEIGIHCPLTSCSPTWTFIQHTSNQRTASGTIEPTINIFINSLNSQLLFFSKFSVNTFPNFEPSFILSVIFGLILLFTTMKTFFEESFSLCTSVIELRVFL